MKTLYSLLGITLVSSLAFTSCDDDEIIQGGNTGEETAQYTVNATVTDFVDEGIAPAIASRANAGVTGVVNWGEGDGLLLWNKRNGGAYGFVMAEGADLTAKTVSFAGEAAVSNDDVVLGFYPKKDFVALTDGLQFALPASATQATAQPELQQTLLMAATSKVTEGQIPELVFKPVVSLLNLKLINNSSYPSSLKIKSVKVDAGKEIFPTVVAVNQNAGTFKLSGNVSALELSLAEQELAQGAELNGMMCVLPSSDAIDASEELTVIVETLNGETPVIFDFTGTVGDLTNNTNKLEAGKKYELSVLLDDNTELPEEGFKTDADGNWTVYTEDAFIKWMAEGDKSKSLKLMKDMDMTGLPWTTISDFSGEFNGNSHTISNLTESLITTNNGKVYNLKIDNATINGTGNAAVIAATNAANAEIRNVILNNVAVSGTTVGAVAGINDGTIENCKVESGVITGVSAAADDVEASVGGLVGHNKKNIYASSVCGVTITTAVSKKSTNVGGLVGQNSVNSADGVNANIQGSFVDKTTEVSLKGGSGDTNRIGGFVGSHWGGNILGCYSNAAVNAQQKAKAGGFVGLVQGPNAEKGIKVCYSTGNVTAVAGSTSGGFIGEIFNAKGETTACYALGTIPTDVTSGTVKGGFAGKNGGANVLTMTKCFTTNTVSNSLGEQVTLENLPAKADEMNTAASDCGFKFVAGGEGEDPLVIEPVTEEPAE